MKVIGLLGGMGPESTVNYYNDIIKRYRELSRKDEYPNILINSIDMTKMLGLVEQNRFDDLIEYLSREIGKLISAGAEICAICSNTPHIVFESLNDKIPIPLVSIVDAAAEEAEKRQVRKLLLIGTSFTMGNDFYSKSFLRKNISLLVPSLREQDVIHNTIFPELEEGIVVPEKRDELLRISRRIILENKLDGIILGCTELPLMIKADDFDTEIFDTVDIHIKELVKQALEM